MELAQQVGPIEVVSCVLQAIFSRFLPFSPIRGHTRSSTSVSHNKAYLTYLKVVVVELQ